MSEETPKTFDEWWPAPPPGSIGRLAERETAEQAWEAGSAAFKAKVLAYLERQRQAGIFDRRFATTITIFKSEIEKL